MLIALLLYFFGGRRFAVEPAEEREERWLRSSLHPPE